MAYCRECGAALPEGTRFCPACGASAAGAPPLAEEVPAREQAKSARRGRRGSLLRRWWFWALIAVLAIGLFGRGTRRSDAAAKQTGPVVAPTAAVTPQPTSAPTAAPTAEPTAAPEEAASENVIRPEVKAFLDSYEAAMDEYVAFMQEYMAADAAQMLSMMGDYYTVLARYGEFAEAIEAMDESELNAAELAYYIEVTTRVSQKLLSAVG